MKNKKDISGFPVIIDIPVRWGDMDAFEHVNNVTYLRYFESARVAYFEAMGILDYAQPRGIGPILGHTSCRYKFPLTYPDSLKVGARVVKIERDRYHQEYIVYSTQHQRVAALGTGVIVSYDYEKEIKAEVSDEVINRINKIEASVSV